MKRVGRRSRGALWRGPPPRLPRVVAGNAGGLRGGLGNAGNCCNPARDPRAGGSRSGELCRRMWSHLHQQHLGCGFATDSDRFPGGFKEALASRRGSPSHGATRPRGGPALAEGPAARSQRLTSRGAGAGPRAGGSAPQAPSPQPISSPGTAAPRLGVRVPAGRAPSLPGNPPGALARRTAARRWHGQPLPPQRSGKT